MICSCSLLELDSACSDHFPFLLQVLPWLLNSQFTYPFPSFTKPSWPLLGRMDCISYLTFIGLCLETSKKNPLYSFCLGLSLSIYIDSWQKRKKTSSVNKGLLYARYRWKAILKAHGSGFKPLLCHSPVQYPKASSLTSLNLLPHLWNRTNDIYLISLLWKLKKV